MNKINLHEKLSLFDDYWNPRVVGELNGQLLKLVKFKGAFTWHHHDNEDELFLVVKGRFRMDFLPDAEATNGITQDEVGAEHEIWLEEGEMIIVPRGTEHRPFAEDEAEVLLFEPSSTLNTGNVEDQFTRGRLERI